jgi:hypothetical protein
VFASGFPSQKVVPKAGSGSAKNFPKKLSFLAVDWQLCWAILLVPLEAGLL